ncbi:MAG: hydrogenase maturation protease [Promethearchaeota archaeon]
MIYFREKLLQRLNGASKVVFMGIGEEKLRDDGVGPYIITELLDLNSSRFKFINAYVDPMSRIDEIIEFNPSHLVIIDTCTLNKDPGTVAIIERDDMEEMVPISSHVIPVHIVVDLLMEKIPSLDAFMIGFVPESMNGFDSLTFYKEGELTLDDLNENIDLPLFEFNLTDTVKRAADKIIEIIKEILKSI